MSMQTTRLTLARKVTFLLAGQGILLLAVAVAALVNLRAAQGTYARLLEGDTQALLYLPRMNLALHDAARIVVLRVNPMDSADTRRTEGDLAEVAARLKRETAAFRQALPQYSPAATDIDRAFAAFMAIGEQARAASQAGRIAQAQRLIRGPFRARFERLRDYFQAFGESIHKALIEEAGAVEARTSAVLRRSLIAGALVLAAGLVAGQLWVWRSLAQPIQILVTAVRRLAAGDERVAIPCGERADEVGLLASTVEVFRQNLIRRRELENEEHQTLQRLQRSEERFRSLVETAPDALLLMDASHRITGANRQTERLFGWARGELIGQPSSILVPGRLRDEHAVTLRRLAELSERLPGAAVEMLGLRKDGSEFPVEVAFARIETDDGDDGTHFVSSMRDITERKRAETELANKVAFQRALIDSIPYPVFIKDAEGRFLGCNRAYEEAFHTSAREIRGRTVRELPYLPEADRERFHAEDLDAIRTLGRRRYELPISFADGRTHLTLYSVDGFSLADGRPGGLIGILVDISDRMAAEAELRRSQNLLQSVIDNAAAYIFVKDLEGRYLLVNQPYADLLHRPASDLLSRTAFDFFPPEAAETFAAGEAEIRRSGNARTTETVFELGGETRHALAHRFPLLDATGQVYAIGGVSTDITEIKRTQTELALARDAAEAANRAKSAFVATMSHEIRTPMNSIINLTALTLETSLTPRQRQYLSVVQSSARGLLALLNDILDFSKIEAGRLELENVAFQLRVLLEEVADSFRGRVLETRIEFGVLVEDDVPDHLMGDTLRLRQVLTNLLGNAFKFTERGEIDLRVRREVPHTEEAPDSEGGVEVLRFSVRDTGIGIPPERIGRLFEAFSQADSSTSRRFGGTGLGLAISRRLVELMHGKIEVRSEPEQGSEFSFTARFDSAPMPATAAGPPQLSAELHRTRVLVIESSDLSRELLVGMLRRFGLLAEGVATGEAGLERLRQSPEIRSGAFGLVILDWILPDTRGVELGRRIRDLPAGDTLPLVMVSAYAGEEEERAAREAGINAFVPKPITGSLLLDAITRATGIRPEIAPPTGAGQEVPAFLKNRRILVAEDNEANQFVVREILERAGAVVEIAGDGRVAVEKALRDPYDLVLMDMQMPEVDGLEATRRIRAELGGQPLPIVALTANALRSDWDACIQAGMDDYVAKPIERAALFATLSRWLPAPDARADSVVAPAPESQPPTAAAQDAPLASETPQGDATQTSEPRSPSVAAPGEAPIGESIEKRRQSNRRKSKPPEESQLELIPSSLPQSDSPESEEQVKAGRFPGVDLEDAMRRLGLPRSVLETMLLQFAEGQRAGMIALRAALKAGESEELRRLSHSMAGAAGNLSMHELRRLARTVELGVRFGQGNLEAMVDDLEREAERVFTGLDALAVLRTRPPAAERRREGTPVVEQDGRAGLENLLTRLEEGDIEAIQSALDLLSGFPPPSELAAVVERVRALAASFEYERAIGIAREALQRFTAT